MSSFDIGRSFGWVGYSLAAELGECPIKARNSSYKAY